jgi:crotonobetainyl-CoA hydratase
MPASSTTSELLVERIGNVAVLTLNRPHVRNAVNTELAGRVGNALSRLASEADVHVCVITGAGSAFCAGMDLREFAGGRQLGQSDDQIRGFAGVVRHRLDKPLIAAVNGAAFGGGAELALACDLVVADDTATFAFPEVRRGLFPGAGGSLRLPRQIPPKVAAELLLTGRSFTAVDAHGWGLVNHVATSGTALVVALELADQIASNAPLAVQAMKRLLRDVSLDQSWEPDAWERLRAELEPVFVSADAREGAAAFTERRAPRWTGT